MRETEAVHTTLGDVVAAVRGSIVTTKLSLCLLMDVQHHGLQGVPYGAREPPGATARGSEDAGVGETSRESLPEGLVILRTDGRVEVIARIGVPILFRRLPGRARGGDSPRLASSSLRQG